MQADSWAPVNFTAQTSEMEAMHSNYIADERSCEKDKMVTTSAIVTDAFIQ